LKFEIYLIKPSKYDDEGYVIRHWRGVLPSNTLACLHGLTRDAQARGALPGAVVQVHLIDEAVMKVPVKKIARAARKPGCRVLACLVGVQTNQLVRASDIALELRAAGAQVMIGGFHVSGMLAMFGEPGPEIRRLMEAGVTVVAGEVEPHWERLLRDAYENRLKPLYNFLSELPDISQAPTPLTDRRYLRRFAFPNYGTIDTSRGCPFQCSFCTIINVQGRKMRHRSPECVERAIRRAYQEAGVSFFFFTDDNFARNPAWEEIFDRVARLREQEGWPIEIMMQVDVLSYRIPGFIEKAVRAGCTNVFIGMESLNARNLKEASKNQNHVDQYRELIEAWHRAGVSTHVGYIIGFPNDTEESVRADLQKLMREVRPQRASFFMMTPLPGSRDHKHLVERGVPLDPDYNNYDSVHECVEHPHLKNGAWRLLYEEAWRTFYSFDNMKAILEQTPEKNYWEVFRNFLWYKATALIENQHPMMAGFFRLKDRKTRRAGFPRLSLLAHWRQRLRENYIYFRELAKLLLEMEELWLQTRKPWPAEQRLRDEMERFRQELLAHPKVQQLQTMYAGARARIPAVRPSSLRLLASKLFLRGTAAWPRSRQQMQQFWESLGAQLKRGRIHALLRLDHILAHAWGEARLFFAFCLLLTSEAAWALPER